MKIQSSWLFFFMKWQLLWFGLCKHDTWVMIKSHTYLLPPMDAYSGAHTSISKLTVSSSLLSCLLHLSFSLFLFLSLSLSFFFSSFSRFQYGDIKKNQEYNYFYKCSGAVIVWCEVEIMQLLKRKWKKKNYIPNLLLPLNTV